MEGWKDCTHIFSNGTEFEMFIEHCFKCKRYKNDHCRILNKCYKAMFDPSEFPYSDLLEHDRYGGKGCKSFTKEPQKRHKRQCKGQISFFNDG